VDSILHYMAGVALRRQDLCWQICPWGRVEVRPLCRQRRWQPIPTKKALVVAEQQKTLVEAPPDQKYWVLLLCSR
jgi:hypothetical protein